MNDPAPGFWKPGKLYRATKNTGHMDVPFVRPFVDRISNPMVYDKQFVVDKGTIMMFIRLDQDRYNKDLWWYLVLIKDQLWWLDPGAHRGVEEIHRARI